jgi:hypothetical protein
MTLVVRTACLKSAAARRDDALDVTRGTGTGDALAFAPSTELLTWVKGEGRRGRLEGAWPLYKQRYLDEMNLSRATNHGPWNKLLVRRSVTFCCYCENPLRCHRYLLGSIVLVGLGATYEGEVET